MGLLVRLVNILSAQMRIYVYLTEWAVCVRVCCHMPCGQPLYLSKGSQDLCAILYQGVSTYGLFEFDISAV
jgi:hypothetical protein